MPMFFSLFSVYFNGRLSNTCFSESRPNRPIFTKISGLVDGLKSLFNSFSLLQSLKGHCHGNQLKLKNQRFSRTNLLCHAAIPKRMAISQFRFEKVQWNEFLCILYDFGNIWSSNPLLTITHFAAIRQKSAYLSKYLRISWTYFDLLYRFGSLFVEMIIPIFVWWSPKGRQPVKFGRCSHTSRGTTFTLCSCV